MTQPLPLNFLENPLSIQNFIKFHQANASLGLALLAQNSTPNPFFPKRSNMILSMNQNQAPMPSMGFDKMFKPAFPQNLFEARLNQASRLFPFMNLPENLQNTLENPFKSLVKVEDSHHSDVTKDSESVKKEDEELLLEQSKSKSQLSTKSKKIAKTPKLRKASTKKPAKKEASPKSEGEEEEESPEDDKAEPKWRRKIWSHSEDKLLMDLIEKYGRKWSRMAAIIGGRTGKQVRDRYLNVLIPDIKRTTWTELEDNLIWALYYQLGTKWCKIAEHLPGRTEGQVKNRFYTHLKRKHEKEEEESKGNLVIRPNLQHLVPMPMKHEELLDKSKTICPKIEA